MKLNVVFSYNKNEERIIYPSGKIIAHDKRYIQESTLSGNLDMPVYKVNW